MPDSGTFNCLKSLIAVILDGLAPCVNGLLKSIRNPGRGCFGVVSVLVLRTYASSLMHLLAYERKLKEEAEATKGETKLKGGHEKA